LTVAPNFLVLGKFCGRKITMKHGNNGSQTITIPRPQNISPNPASTTNVPLPKAELVAMVVALLCVIA